MSDEEARAFLASLRTEPIEYYATLHDRNGDELAGSRTEIAPVTSDCQTAAASLRGRETSLIVGETASWQQDIGLYHWLCDGVVTRIDPAGVLVNDGTCRNPVVS